MTIIPYTPELAKLPPDGVYSGVPNEVYHRSWDACGRSALKMMAVDGLTPSHVRDAFLRPQEPSASMNLGTAVGDMIDFPDEIRVLPAPDVDRRTKDGKATYAAFIEKAQGKLVLPHDDYQEAVKMVENLRKHPAASVLLEDPGHIQLSLVWTDKETGLRCKCRPDKICPESGIAIDLKTAACAASRTFANAMFRYGYHLQAAFYSRGLEVLEVMRVDHWIDIVVENEPPHCVAVYQIGAASIAHALASMLPHMHRLAECYRTGNWKGYALDIQPIELPAWVLKIEPDYSTEGE